MLKEITEYDGIYLACGATDLRKSVEEELKELTPEERKGKRQERSKPVLEAYWSWLKTINPLQGSKLGEAVTYALNQKDALETFLEDGQIEISYIKDASDSILYAISFFIFSIHFSESFTNSEVLRKLLEPPV